MFRLVLKAAYPAVKNNNKHNVDTISTFFCFFLLCLPILLIIFTSIILILAHYCGKNNG